MKTFYIANSQLKRLLSFLLFVICFHPLFAQEIISYRNSDGIMFELFENDTNRFIYSSDNTVYTDNKLYVYSYTYSKYGEEFLFQGTGEENWEFVLKANANDSAARTIEMQIITDSTFQFLPKTTSKGQSILHYSFYNALQDKLPVQSFTGLVENPKNIWLHPPRSFLFRILELNPFPYIKFPVEKGLRWKWKLTIGSQWGDARWKEWSSAIVNKYKYRITETDHTLETALGPMVCTVVEATAKNRIGTTKATFYFEETIGFVKYEYVNIDGSTITFDLIHISEQ